jgi:repressor LexA
MLPSIFLHGQLAKDLRCITLETNEACTSEAPIHSRTRSTTRTCTTNSFALPRAWSDARLESGDSGCFEVATERCLTFAFHSPKIWGMAITRQQRKMYDFISHFLSDRGYSPSYEEIKQGMGLRSLATVHKHISNMEKKNLLTRDYNRSRSIDLVPLKGKLKQSMTAFAAYNQGLMLPLMGRIVAGQPLEAIENPETISLADFVRSKEVFVLQVSGDSMQDEHILDGDYVLVEKTKVAHNGDIVVGLVDGMEATLKRFYREGDSIRLQPSNANMQPIIVAASRVQVQGRVIGVLRKY